MPPEPAAHDLEVFYDGDCPLCRREMEWLRWFDRRRSILFTDIAAEAFRPEAAGKSYGDLMGEIHARQRDGLWITGVEVFRRLYQAAGFGPLIWLTRCPGISHLLDWGYLVFARNRLRLTGRCATGICSRGGAD